VGRAVAQIHACPFQRDRLLQQRQRHRERGVRLTGFQSSIPEGIGTPNHLLAPVEQAHLFGVPLLTSEAAEHAKRDRKRIDIAMAAGDPGLS